MDMTRYRTWLLAFLVLLVSGCATLCPPKTQLFTGRPEACQQFLDRLDEKVHTAGVKDNSTSSVPCFSYLRSNRFLSALKTRLDNDAEREYWLQWMRELDLRAREKEIRNLPDEAILCLESIERGASFGASFTLCQAVRRNPRAKTHPPLRGSDSSGLAQNHRKYAGMPLQGTFPRFCGDENA
jgi:hypothetical protein